MARQIVMEVIQEPPVSIYAKHKTLSVMLTYACPAECTNCGTSSSPRDKNSLNLDVVMRGIEQAKQLGFVNIVFTGGEATLRWNDLLAAIKYADKLELPTRLVTNAHWAINPAVAAEKLDKLLQAGLKEINFSTGDEHVRFVPLERVIYAAITAVERKLIAHVMVELRSKSRISKKSILDHYLIQQLSEEKKKLIQPTESPWMPLNPLHSESYPDGIAINSSNLSSCVGCESVLQTYTLQADGRIGACCGLGMRLIPELDVGKIKGEDFLSEAIQVAEEDFLKVWMHYKGPEKILAWAAQYNPEISWENMYGHRCQSCIRIYQDSKIHDVIREHYHEIIPELLQSVWLRDHYIPNKLAAARAV
jgi:pyruvate-formate lyase-activating enzyme